MRGTVAKRLRRIVAQRTVGVPEHQYEHAGQDTLTIRLKPGCGRWMYKQFKRQYFQYQHGGLK